MKYYSTLPLTAVVAFSLMTMLVHFGVLPPGLSLLDQIQGQMDDYFYLLIMIIILLESIVYVGFYFPGQFFAVVLVITSQPTMTDVIALTFAMVLAATLGSLINYSIGRANSDKFNDKSPTKLKHLLLAMIHMNSLAFFMLAQGANHRPMRVVWLAGLLNLPYYLALIAATAFMSEEVMQIAENSVLVFSLLAAWLIVAVTLDVRKHRSSQPAAAQQATDTIVD
ncbi:hypothetical protein QTP81_08695 [Alteromonas sp. ASW11-36]|uniref:Membrane-associated protein n=1 Tax=Alteromonas arenosi TaxID=3055817 RepID=A0ABT7SYQ2_9ALTE|nr:hypothetical protein [Alteromonas sp. ASW11-36]MDM7860672.1 hypothetical protein [Alteromonas sp. ASW11-36]